jgi:molybdenum cofactor cytidylyltransferase
VIVAVVLAAGAGERFGGPKALAEIDGRSLAEIAATTCASAPLDEVVVVTGAQHAQVAERVARVRGEVPVRVVENARWREGRTGSLQAGWPDGAHALVFPVDMPAVRLVTLDTLLGVHGYAAAEPDVVVPVVERDGRRRGHPILMSSRLRAEVMALGPDQPLHEVVHAHVTLEVPVDDDGILLDVDVPADLVRAAALLRSRASS